MHVTGGNGAGKSTLLRCLAGTMPVTSGTLQIQGRPTTARASRAVVGACLHPEQGLYPRLSGRENLLFAARLLLPADRVAAAVAGVERELGVTPFADQPARGYSAGMRARVGIARALLGSPVVLLFDEPTRSLDEAGREMFWAAVRARSDTACVFASHLPQDRDHATSVTALADGRPVDADRPGREEPSGRAQRPGAPGTPEAP